MTRQEFFELCNDLFGTNPDYPFEDDFETTVFRHGEGGKWFGLLMSVEKRFI